ncbi:MAG: penicillin-binding transpeptidase domain-containing protein, partial [Mangrovicoccus sp.]
GRSVAPFGVANLRLQGDSAPLFAASTGIGERVISETAARQLTYMLFEVVQNGTGKRAQLEGRQVAGKTGTTQSARDAWFVGFTGDYIAGVWMGNDDNQPLKGVTGGGLPTEIWAEAMADIHQGLPPRALPMDPPRASDLVANQSTPQPQNPFPPQQPQILKDINNGLAEADRKIGGFFKRIFGGN